MGLYGYQQAVLDPWRPYSKSGQEGTGYNEMIRYHQTFGGVVQWVKDYLNRFPFYAVTMYNCQRFSIGLYNSLTKSSKLPYQYHGMNALGSVGVVGNRLGSNSDSGGF